MMVAAASFELADDWIRYASVPLIAAVIGWTSNWLGIRMAFYPVKFVGLWDPWIGWQGIVPRRAAKMASFAVDSAVTKLATVAELIEMMEPDETFDYLIKRLGPLVPEVVNEVASREYPRIWGAMSDAVKQAVYDHCSALLPAAMKRVQPEVIENIDQLIDARAMMIESLSADPSVLVDVMWRAGQKQFWVLIHSGGVFAFFLGIIQVGVQLVIPSPWVLPIFGIFVGYFTNFLALKMIFEPVVPKKIGPITLHAAFLKRKRELAEFFAAVAAQKFVTVPMVMERLLTGPNKDRVETLVRTHAAPLVDQAIGIAKPAAQAALGSKELDALKTEMGEVALGLAPTLWDDEEFVESRAKLLEAEMFNRLYNMSDDEFSNLLRPVVEEDEWKLVAVGAALGMASGMAQVALIFGGFG